MTRRLAKLRDTVATIVDVDDGLYGPGKPGSCHVVEDAADPRRRGHQCRGRRAVDLTVAMTPCLVLIGREKPVLAFYSLVEKTVT